MHSHLSMSRNKFRHVFVEFSLFVKFYLTKLFMKCSNSGFENILKLQGSYINGYCQEQSCSWKFFLLLQTATDVPAVTLEKFEEGGPLYR